MDRINLIFLLPVSDGHSAYQTPAMSSKEEQKKSEIKDFDDILNYVGGWGPFQYFITAVFFLFNIFLGYVYLSPIITLYTPPHFCKVPQLANFSLEERRNISIPKDAEVLGKNETQWRRLLSIVLC